ncbi:DUF308 domain-containing protein [Catellatospora sp. NPDC049609]|uniref:HdeD family acid-resistance protein n=1 Tax=Catellatospora sp. NPDC049609 TaxID=3155505 RepID=UPI0034316C1D
MTDPYGDAELETAALQSFKRMAIIGGLVSLAAGLFLVFWPDKTLLFLITLLGVWLVVVGIFRVVEGLTSKGVSGGHRALIAVIGVLYIIVGVVCLRNLTGTVTLLAVILGIVWIVGGVAEIVTGFARTHGTWPKIGTVLLGLLSVAAGLILFFWPGPTLTVLVWVTGLWLIALGIIQLILGIGSSRAAKKSTITPRAA